HPVSTLFPYTTLFRSRERALQLVLVVLGVLTAGANIYPLVTSLLALRPTSGTTAPMFYTILATLGVFLVLAARNPSAHRSLIARSEEHTSELQSRFDL